MNAAEETAQAQTLTDRDASAAPAPPAEDDLPEILVTADSSRRLLQTLRDLWLYRELFRALTVREIRLRYRQTALGIIWVVLQPLLSGGIFALVFQRLGALSDRSAVDAMLFFMAGLVPWTAFATAVTKGAASLEGSAGLITKVYFPRLLVPFSYVAVSIVDFVISFAILFAIALWAGQGNLLVLAFLPVLLLVQVLTATGLAAIFGALNAQYHDVKHVVPVLLLLGMFVTVLAPLDAWSTPVRTILSLNPMTAVIESLRALLFGQPLDWFLILQGGAVALAVFLAGVLFFRAREQHIVDIL